MTSSRVRDVVRDFTQNTLASVQSPHQDLKLSKRFGRERARLLRWASSATCSRSSGRAFATDPGSRRIERAIARVWCKTWDKRTELRASRAPCVAPAICDRMIANASGGRLGNDGITVLGTNRRRRARQSARFPGRCADHLYNNYFCNNATLNYTAFWKPT
jgi:hypothetical protein